MADDNSKDPKTVIAILCGIVAAAPGMLLLSIIRTFWVHNLDMGQMGTFAFLFHCFAFLFVWAVVGVLIIVVKPEVAMISRVMLVYAMLVWGFLSLIIFPVSLVCAFGFHAQCFRRAMSLYFGWPDAQ